MNNDVKDGTKDTRFDCSGCGANCIIDDLQRNPVKITDEKFCRYCFYTNFKMCDFCEKTFDRRREVMHYYRNGIACQKCTDEHLYSCDNCGEYIEEGGDCNCEDGDDDYYSLPLRDYSSGDEFCGNNKRCFSTEIECYYPNNETLRVVAKAIPKEIGICEDGSLDSNGIEFNTPKLSGRIGEKMLKDFCQILNDNEFYVNGTCGLHVHLDGKDYLKNINAIQKLMVFFLVYEDVILSFLPSSRRENTYCNTLSEFYHLKEIKECYSLEEFEKIWYRDDNTRRIEERKQDKHDGSRYAGINFHSLLANGHLEIRYHSGTINYTKMIMWIKMFVMILDEIGKITHRNATVNRNLESYAILKARFILGLPEKTLSFFNAIGLPEDMRTYFLERQKKFIGNSEEENN